MSISSLWEAHTFDFCCFFVCDFKVWRHFNRTAAYTYFTVCISTCMRAYVRTYVRPRAWFTLHTSTAAFCVCRWVCSERAWFTPITASKQKRHSVHLAHASFALGRHMPPHTSSKWGESASRFSDTTDSAVNLWFLFFIWSLHRCRFLMLTNPLHSCTVMIHP